MTREQFEVENGKEYGFSKALYDAICPICKDDIEWTANFDADGSSYSEDHKDCGLSFYMDSNKVTVQITEYEE